MLVEDMAVVTAETAVATVGMLPDMPRPGMLRAGTLVLLCAAAVGTVMRCLRAGMPATQDGRITALAAEAGEVVPGIRTLDIPGLAITVTAPVGGTIRIIHIILTDTDTRPI